VFEQQLLLKYEISSIINRTLFTNHIIIIIHFYTVMHIFLYTFPATLHTVAIARAASLCPFQKSLLVLVEPSLHEKFKFIFDFNLFLPRVYLTESNK
jgi:hypothetical protein